MSVRLYGHFQGESSFAQVTRGMQRALEAAEAYAGWVAIDAEQEGAGALAPVSLNCGHPRALMLAHQVGHHREHWLLLAPNGERLPEGFAASLRQPSDVLPRGLIDGLLAPSRWAQQVLEREFPGLPVVHAPHGVTPEVHQVDHQARGRAIDSYWDGEFNVLHMTSTDTERKGTEQLLQAWATLKGVAGAPALLPPAARLYVSVNMHYLSQLRWLLADAHLVADRDYAILAGFAQEPKRVAELYGRMHLVCQPSRGEGFGLCPLEARCCGTPVAMTAATGHGEHVDGAEVVIATHEDAPMNDFPGSMAPRLEVRDIVDALHEAYVEYERHHQHAVSAAPELAEHWDWRTVCAPAVNTLKQR